MTRTNQYIRHKARGYSLIEMLIYMGLLGIFLFSLTNLFVSSLDLRVESEAQAAVESDARFLMARFRYDITHADYIATPGVLGVNGNSLVLIRDGTTYTYTLSGDDLMVSDGTTSSQLNTGRTKINSVGFTRLGNVGGKNTVTVTLAIESEAQKQSGSETRDYQMTFATR